MLEMTQINTIKKMKDGTEKLETPDGKVFIKNQDGSINVTMPNIKSINLEDITCIKSYRIWRGKNKVTHKITYLNDGYVNLVYNNQGEIQTFQAYNIVKKISNDNNVIIKMI